MSITSIVNYLGNLRAESTHVASNSKILTDAPVDNHGLGEAFSPTDLVATALATCIITTIGIVINQGRLPNFDMKAEVIKSMLSSPRRIGKIEIAITITNPNPTPISDDEKKFLEHCAHVCAVAKSLHPDIEQVVTFIYQ